MCKVCNYYHQLLFGIFLFSSITIAAVTNEVTLEDGNNKLVPQQTDLKVTSPLSAQQLWDKLYTLPLPAGVTNFSVEFKTGCNYSQAAGSYTDMAFLNGIKPKDGILLTSGKADIAIGPNNETDAGLDQDGGDTHDPGNGDADLTAMVPGYESFDACLLTLKFTTDTSVHGITFDFVFGTDEFPEYVNSLYNDIFCAFLDGENICFDHNNNLINVNNDFFQIDNQSDPLNLEYDGFTPLLRTSDTLTEGNHTLKFAICDMGDQILDAGVFLSNFKFEYTNQGTDPVSIIDDQVFEVMENSPGGTLVGNVVIKVPDSMGVTLQVVNVVPEFDLDSLTPYDLTVANGANLDYETQNQYTLTVVASMIYDLMVIHDTAIITVNILDYSIGDLIDDQEFSVLENSAGGTDVGTIVFKQPDSIVTMTVIQGVPEFDVDESTGKITVANGADLDYEKQNVYYIYVVVKADEAKDDTAKITINILDVEEPSAPDIDSAVIYDGNGDGIGDSLFIVFKSGFSLFSPYKAKLTWPNGNADIHTLDITQANIQNSREVTIAFTPFSNAPVLTQGTGSVTVLFDSLGVDLERTADVLDGIGPLLKDKAYLVERFIPGNDTLTVLFTEKVAVDAIKSKSFILIKGNSGDEIELTLLDPAVDQGNEESILFAIADLGSDAPQEGDSVKILHTGPVVDKRVNHAHSDNTPVPIVLVKRPNPVEKAAYYDTNGDGIVEQVRIHFAKEIDPSSLKCRVTWLLDNASGNVDNLEYYNNDHKILKADIKDIFGSVQKDRTSGKMKLTLTYTDLNNVTADYSDVLDRAAPVITEALYWFSATFNSNQGDTLLVTFSETVKDINAEEPFDLLQTSTNSTYSLRLEQIGHYGVQVKILC